MKETKIKRSDLPFGSEFSPSQISLKKLLEKAKLFGGDWKAFEASVMEDYFSTNETSDYNKKKLANNTKLGMIAYGIIDRDANLTIFGKKLYDLREDEELLYEELGKYILLNLNGMNLVQCVLDMQAGGEVVTLLNLRSGLQERGIHFPRGGKHPSIMRLWLEKAGVFSGGWRVNEAQLEKLLGSTTGDFEVLAGFTPEQRAYLKALANIGGNGPHMSNDVERIATATYGIKFNEKNLPKQVLYPLQEANYILLSRGTKSDGRGAKPFSITATEKLNSDLILPLIEQLEKQTQEDIRPFLRKPIGEILIELDSKDRYIAGLALEALAFKLMRLIDLTYVATRVRGTATGGAEVDLIFDSNRVAFSRWQVQCKNTSRVSLEDVAKEIGLTHSLKSNIVVIVTTGEIGSEARRYADKVMTDSHICVIMMDGKDLEIINTNQIKIIDVLNRESNHAMKLKKLSI